MKLTLSSWSLKFALLTSCLVLIGSMSANAISASEWKPGRIIEDELFTDNTSMNIQEIQTFLNSKVPTCDTWGEGSYYGVSRAQYGTSKGYPPPFTCLKDYYEVPKTAPGNYVPANNYGRTDGWKPDGSKSSAEIIWQAAQDFSISPKVLLVTLQKESGLITDDWPLSKQLVYAMGAHCPDTGPGGSANCDPNYSGFSFQIRESADLLRYYLDNMQQSWWSNKKPYQNNNILYNPNVNCSSSSVYMENKATTALYVYTPYQPNTAALNAGYGTGDSCSAYGNRNFWLYYNDWFGYSLRRPYAWKYSYQAAYPDLSFSPKLNSPLKLEPGQKIFMTLAAVNNGSKPWLRNGPNPIKLGTTEPNDRPSDLCDPSSWLDCSRPALLTQDTVQPGETGTFGFWITAPQAVGYYKERFNLVAEGLTWLNDPGLYFDFSVIPTYKWEFQSVDYYLDSAKTRKTSNGELVVAEDSYVTVKVKNTGNVVWTNSDVAPIRLATISPYNRISRLCTSEWTGCDRAARLQERNVEPGQVGTFEFKILNPKEPSLYGEPFNLVIEGDQWMKDAKMTLWLGTKPRNTSWNIVSQNSYSDSTKQSAIDLSDVIKNQKVFISIVAKNNGNVVWTKGGGGDTRVGTAKSRDHRGTLYDTSWIDTVRTSSLKEDRVLPGQNGTFEFYVKAPSTAGAVNESYDLLTENRYWLDGTSINLNLNVKQ